MADQGQPVWGTPDPVTPVSRTPAPPRAGRLTPALTAALQSGDEFEIVENADFLGDGGYELSTTEGARVGTVVRETTGAGLFFGDAVTSQYLVYDGEGASAADMVREGSFTGTGRSELHDIQGTPLGSVEVDGAFFGPPQLRILGANGRYLRLIGGSWINGNAIEVVSDDAEPVVMANVQRSVHGFFSGTHRYWVGLSPSLSPVDRFLIMIAVIRVDEVKDR
ncbi:hypothetical protein [Kineosporia sp. NBRC 101731]|uniref:hypothetical protein n=1 Tax=Kineosporia sp. NBRC 101731 TaxID=3032199 RepID=UPI0024A34915|nr:hypothetical protein [Kineosporia sp. NBRC 101731]GLY33048.1 hypothetical protein Kisp02_64130 [Kineosporia sp. NBRC 101731]